MIESLYEKFKNWSAKGTVWLYSDPHFGDEELRAGIKKRPEDDELVRLINSKVGKHDTLIILGDVGNVDYVRKLKGYKVLIMGNHDAGARNYKRNKVYFKYDANEYTYEDVKKIALSQPKPLSKSKISIEKGYDVSHAPFEYFEVEYDNALFDEVYEGPLMIGEKLILSHEPLDINWAFNIHGHTHLLEHNRKGHLCVCADVIDYTPISLNTFIKSGRLQEVETLHRATIDTATARKKHALL